MHYNKLNKNLGRVDENLFFNYMQNSHEDLQVEAAKRKG